jgi:hypothetical protein
MWGFHNKRSALHEQLLLAPESNPSEFVRRYLANKDARKERFRLATSSSRSKVIAGMETNKIQSLFAG